MTRFARARGSKSSNQRLPHPPTNWSEMKQQLLETNQTMDQRKIDDNVDDEQKIKKMRLENYEKFLNEEADSKNNVQWAEFEAENKDSDDNGPPDEINSKPALIEADDDDDDGAPVEINSKPALIEAENDDNDNDDDDDGAPVEINSKQALIEAENDNNDHDDDDNDDDDGAPVEINSKQALIEAENDDNDDDDGSSVEINSKPALIEAENDDNDDDDDDDDDDAPLEVSSKQPVEEIVKPVQVKMEKKKIVEIQPQQKNKILEIIKKDTKIVERKKKRQQKQLIKKRIKTGQIDEGNLKETGEEIEKPTEIVAKKQLKKPQIKVNDKNVKNKKTKKAREETEIIHGRQIVIKHLDGFRIKKEDYERIMQLKKDLKTQKQPKEVIAEAVKRVRRVAEKKLRNEYKKVCFKCRQPGHQFTECPQSQMETNSSGVCFKCGSTEHTHYQCKVVKNDNFRYATCFICGNEGHISRQCPQNTNGVYPKGGNCLVCGSNGHLKKDCPQFRQQQQEQKSNDEFVGLLDSFKNPEVDDFDDKKLIKTKKVKRVNFNK